MRTTYTPACKMTDALQGVLSHSKHDHHVVYNSPHKEGCTALHPETRIVVMTC